MYGRWSGSGPKAAVVKNSHSRLQHCAKWGGVERDRIFDASRQRQMVIRAVLPGGHQTFEDV